MLKRRLGVRIYILVCIVLTLGLITYMKHYTSARSEGQFNIAQIGQNVIRNKRSEDVECCDGILGYATSNAQFPITCPKMKCCNGSETVAVIPIEDSLGFRFRCLPKTKIRPVCYQPGTEVRSSNQDPDHIPRACCEGAKFELELNKWYAAMSVKCVLR